MKRVHYLIVLVVLIYSCTSREITDLNRDLIEGIRWKKVDEKSVVLDSIDTETIVYGLNNSEEIETREITPIHELEIEFKTGEFLELKIREGIFIITDEENRIYKSNLDELYFEKLTDKYIYSSYTTIEYWDKLNEKHGGCLIGNQYSFNSKTGEENGVLNSDKRWREFLSKPKNELTNLLLRELSDTMTTKIHTCPFKLASKGELALYCLQQIYQINWFDFKEFEEYRDKEITNETENHQSWLQNILTRKEEREVLIDNWKKVSMQ